MKPKNVLEISENFIVFDLRIFKHLRKPDDEQLYKVELIIKLCLIFQKQKRLASS